MPPNNYVRMKCADFDPGKVSFEKRSMKSFKLCFGEGMIPVIQTPPIRIMNRYVPSLSFYKEDKFRNFIRLCLHPGDPNDDILINIFGEIDTLVIENKHQYMAQLGYSDEVAESIEYWPILSSSRKQMEPTQLSVSGSKMTFHGANNVDQKNHGKKAEYCRLDLITSVKHHIKTQVLVQKHGQASKSRVPIDTMTELEQYLPMGSEARFLISEMYLMVYDIPGKNPEDTVRMCSIRPKIMQMLIRQPEKPFLFDFGDDSGLEDEEDDQDSSQEEDQEDGRFLTVEI